MRFVDWVGFRDEENFKESEHPRDKDGKFKSGSSASGGSLKEPKRVPKSSKTVKWAKSDPTIGLDAHGNVTEGMESRFIGKPYHEAAAILKEERIEKYQRLEKEWAANPNKVTEKSSFKEIADSITCKAAAKHAVEMATRKCFGLHKAKLDGETVQVCVSNVAVPEASNKIGRRSCSQEAAIEEGRRHVFALEHLDQILTEGNVSEEWDHDPNHHPEFDFRTFHMRLEYDGKNPVFAVDVSRPHESPEGRKELYSVTNEFNMGFETKVEKLKLKVKDEMPARLQVVRIRCSLDGWR